MKISNIFLIVITLLLLSSCGGNKDGMGSKILHEYSCTPSLAIQPIFYLSISEDYITIVRNHRENYVFDIQEEDEIFIYAKKNKVFNKKLKRLDTGKSQIPCEELK